TRSAWLCTLERDRASDDWSVRLGFNYLKGLRRATEGRIGQARPEGPFLSILDLVRRVPGIRKEEIESLAEAGALNFIGSRGQAPGARGQIKESRLSLADKQS